MSDVLVSHSSECAPSVLWVEPVVLDDKLESGGSFLGAVGVRPVRVAVRSAHVLATGAVSPFGGVCGAGSLATDSLRRALMVADCTLAAYSAAMRSATGPMHAV